MLSTQKHILTIHAMKKKFSKLDLKKIASIQKKYGVGRHEAARMYVRSGL